MTISVTVSTGHRSAGVVIWDFAQHAALPEMHEVAPYTTRDFSVWDQRGFSVREIIPPEPEAEGDGDGVAGD